MWYRASSPHAVRDRSSVLSIQLGAAPIHAGRKIMVAVTALDAVVPSALSDSRIVSTLVRVFGHAALRPAQAGIVRDVLAGHDILAVLPTGGGKSLCYQLPAVLDDPSGLTLVVSPLIALMEDQVDALRARGVPAAALHGLLTAAEAGSVMHAAARGQLRLLYVSPERLVGSGGLRALLARAGVRRVVVDEAHCVVRWGPDFRPDYLGLGDVLPALGDPQLLALTATATRADQREILRLLGRPRARVVVAGFDRPEIFYGVCHTPSRGAKAKSLMRVLRRAGRTEGAVLVYVGTRSEAESVARWLVQRQQVPAAAYHAGLPAIARTAVQQAFMASRLRAVVATTAFGMGIDKPDVRAVVHWTLPGDLTEYIQAAGRAGRDGDPALALMLYAPEDRRLREWQIAGDAPSAADLSAAYIALEIRATFGGLADERTITENAGLVGARLKGALVCLQRAGVVRRAVGVADAWTIVRPPRGRELAELAAAAADRRVERRRALEEVIAYATGDHCRRWKLLAHVGQGRPTPGPHCCDVCRSTVGPVDDEARPPPSAAVPQLDRVANQPPLESLVLGAIHAREGHATVRGMATALSRAAAATGQPRPRLRQADIGAAVDRLVDARLVVVHHGAEPARLALTRLGRERLETRWLGKKRV
jgi:ATP-dependent DNA helicase RecQ